MTNTSPFKGTTLIPKSEAIRKAPMHFVSHNLLLILHFQRQHVRQPACTERGLQTCFPWNNSNTTQITSLSKVLQT